jgi:hypothetical protein
LEERFTDCGLSLWVLPRYFGISVIPSDKIYRFIDFKEEINCPSHN